MYRTLLALLLALAPALLGQSIFFGDAVPQTHTRYGGYGAEPRLTTNGQQVSLFWANDSKVRVTKLVDGEKRAGRPVLDVDFGWFDVVWTGSHFLVAAYDADEIRGRLLNANGDPIGEPFTIAVRNGRPRLAFDGTHVLMVYGPPDGQMHSILLRPDGTQASDPQHQLLAPWQNIEAVAAAGGPGFTTAMSMRDLVRITILRPDGETAGSAQFTVPHVPERRVAVGSNGQNVLAVWTNGTAAVEFATARARSVSGRTAIAGTEGSVAAAVAWNGAKWVVSTITNGKLQTRLIDPASETQVLTQSAAHEQSPVSLVSLNGRTLAAWRGQGAGRPVLVRDVSASTNGETAAFGAAEQTLQTASSSHEAALLVWSDLRDGQRTLHAGTRTASGGWSESRIGGDDDAPLASSDGNLFLVVKKSSSGWSAVTLTSNAKITASTPAVTSFMPTGITWDGGGWVVIGVSAQSNIFAVRVMPWGAVSAPVLIAEHRGSRELENPRIVWGGGGFFAVWQDSESAICFPICDPYDSVLHGARLTPALQRIDAQNLELAPDEAVSPDVFWDGARYVLFWANEGSLETRTVRPDGARSGITRILGAEIETNEVRAVETSVGAAITSNDGEVLLIRDGTLITRYDLGRTTTKDALVGLGVHVVYAQTAVQDDMPYHGAPHLFLRVGGVLPPRDLPSPPRIVRASMLELGSLMAIGWTAPADPVNGYRIEYRTNDGSWNELDHWFDAATTSMSIRPWLDGATYQFRIRAWSDSGVSAYSAPVTVRVPGKRRSVR